MPAGSLTAAEFTRRLRWLVFHTWNIPPVAGFGFILLIGVLTPAQVVHILTTPLEPAYILGWLAFTVWYLPRKMRPLANWLDGAPGSSFELAVQAVRRFPLLYWGCFLGYLVIAPVSVIKAAELGTTYVAAPVDYFRIELVALTISIIVGLPIFFRVFDLFGQALGSRALKQPIVTIRTKVFLIGALVPLLIDTMLVQYYWTRTGFFSTETFLVWLFLELIAIAGSLIFAHSFGQSLAPLQGYLATDGGGPQLSASALRARSTDELGVLTGDYRGLLTNLQLQGEVLEINNQLLRSTGNSGVEKAFAAVVDLCQRTTRSDQAFLIVHDPGTSELVGVAQTRDGYRPDGHFRLRLDETSLAVWVFKHRLTAAVEDTANDPRVSPRMRERFGVQSTLATPLWLEGEVQGVLMVIDHRSRRYLDREIALLETLAREAALTLQTQRLRQAREHAEAERRERAEQVQLLMDSTEEGIYGADTAGMCTFVNRAAVRMLGYSKPEDLLGQQIHDLIHHSHPDGSRYPLEECRVRVATQAGRSTHADDEVHWRADRTSFPVEYWSHPIYRNGKLEGVVVAFVDITERKRAEERIRRINVELEERVALRTAELQAASDAAERANHAKDDFLSRMSHELRTPLNAILGFAQILRLGGQDPSPAQRDEQLAQIEKAGWHLLDLINEVLDLSRIEAGTMAVSREPVDLQSLCAECARLVQQLAGSSGIQIADEAAQGPPVFALADRTRLRQVLTNLLTNGIKYNRPGGVVTLATGVGEDGQVELRVADTGAGFGPEQLRNLYQPFNRLGAEGGTVEGTGIGLVITKRLVELMDGSIELTTEPGQGSCFTVRLPPAQAAEVSVAPPHAALAQPGASPSRELTVLYIEDNPSNVELVRSTLKLRPGTQLIAAPDGPTGLALLDSQRPDLILVDIALPGIDGYEVCRRVRARSELASVPVIALSANAMQADIERGLQAGFDSYLTKPLDVALLLAHLDRLGDGTGSRRE